MQPLIGITCSRKTGGAWGVCSLEHFMDYTFSDYSQGLLHAGAAAVIIPAAHTPETLDTILNHLQGLVLSGGVDVHPRHYGENPIQALGELDDELDVMELGITRLALERNIPLLAICRGIQVLNVALGGTLYQDLPSQMPGSICHTPKADKRVMAHAVRLTEDGLLHRLCETSEIRVNSQHHQAIKQLAPGLVVEATAPDGVIEAVVYPANRFVLGVQWHPEGTWRQDVYSKHIFEALVAAIRHGDQDS